MGREVRRDEDRLRAAGVMASFSMHSDPEVVVSEAGELTYFQRHVPDRLNVRKWWADLRTVNPVKYDMTLGYLPALKKAKERKGAIVGVN